MREPIQNLLKQLEKCEGFDWDEGNQHKNWTKHRVSTREAEEVFFNQPQVFFYDKKHSQKEDRFGVLGRTDSRRGLTITFTIRGKKIRVVSARDQQRGRERKRYKVALEAESHV
jgi:uncharacterized DUF497 family protein